MNWEKGNIPLGTQFGKLIVIEDLDIENLIVETKMLVGINAGVNVETN